MLDTALHSRCEERLKELLLPYPFTIEGFQVGLSTTRRRPLHVGGMPSPALEGPSGVWIATPEADYVFVDEGARGLHREHIVLHELAHMICDHSGAPVLSHEDAAALLPSLDGATVARVLGRTRYSQAEEREAELLATLIGQRARCEPGRRLDPDVQALRDRLRATLG